MRAKFMKAYIGKLHCTGQLCLNKQHLVELFLPHSMNTSINIQSLVWRPEYHLSSWVLTKLKARKDCLDILFNLISSLYYLVNTKVAVIDTGRNSQTTKCLKDTLCVSPVAELVATVPSRNQSSKQKTSWVICLHGPSWNDLAVRGQIVGTASITQP